MSRSHTSTPTSTHTLPSRFDATSEVARSHGGVSRSSSTPVIRLPSYRELTAASQCEDLPPRRARSNLFTAGLIHLSPSNAHGLASASSAKSHHNAHHYESPETGGMDYNSDDEYFLPSLKDNFLDLPLHCPTYHKPPHRVPSPYNDSLNSVESTDLELSDELGSSHREITLAGKHSLRLFGSNSISKHREHGLHSALWLPTNPHALPDYAAPPKLKFSHAKAGGRTKKQALSCFFCRERKIACGRPDEGSPDQRCNQCARRKIDCTYPTVSHRGQHSRIKSAARKALGGYNPTDS
ncbi:hypothetical protein C8J57DRAFT_226666 [Mycena rebaudengoi]|nr:hypothetical protein C8J57DRAFT_226666 [Mycena rebaudengoi]